MTTKATQIDARACASAVMAALGDLQGYLNASVNPDRIALADLEMEPMGWTKRVHSKRAFEIWKKQLELFGDDPLTLHHMAIMHHARALELEAGQKPTESDADWSAAMGYWHRLHGLDVFWDNLTAKACAGTNRQDVIKKLRAELPQLILNIHYDIALDRETREKRKLRAKFHIAMAQKGPFDAQHRTEAQRAAYNQYMKQVPDEVWQPNELREEVLTKGQKAIIEYLDFDPGCVPALEDALRLQRRVQRSRNTTWRALGQNDPQRKALLLLERKDAEAWRPFFDQLVAMVDQLEEDVREDLARWYHGRGGDLCALDLEEKAVEFYDRSVGLCRPDDDGRKVYLRELVRTLAYVAREKAGKGDSNSKAYCDKVRARRDLTAHAYFFLAQAYLQLSLFDVATDVCDQGLKVDPDFDDLEADDWIRRLTQFKHEIAIGRLMSSARQALEAGKYKEALPPLNEAEKIAKAADTARQHKSIYWMRTQAHLALDQISEAKRDVKLHDTLLDEKSSASDIQAGEKLQELVAAKEEMLSVKPLLDKAKQAMEAGRFKDALPPLDEAAKKAPRNDVIFFLRAQAHMALGSIAEAQRDAKTVADLAETGDDRKNARRLDEMIVQAKAAAALKPLLDKAKQAMEAGRFKDALPPLDEAAKKAPRNDVIFFLRAQAHMALGSIAEAQRDAKTVADLAETDDDRKNARRLDEMIVQAKAAAALKPLLDKAKQAMEAGRFKDALPPLDEAAKKAPRNDVIFFLRAQAHMVLGSIAEAQRDAKTVADLAETDDDRKNARRLDEMIVQAKAAAALKPLLDKAKQAMAAGRFADAQPPLDEAARKAPRNGMIYFMRAQARMGAKNFTGALEDAQKFNGLAESNEEKEAAKQLMKGLFGVDL